MMLHDSSMGIDIAVSRLVCDDCDKAQSHRMTVSMLADVLVHGYTCQGCIDRAIRMYRMRSMVRLH